MPSLVMIVPGDLDTRTGGYGYDRRVVDGLRASGWTVDVRALDESFPRPTQSARADAVRQLASLADDTTVVIDGLALGVLADEAEAERARLRIVALVHHPLALETGLAPSEVDAFMESERRALGTVRLVIVTSRATAAALTPYHVPVDRIVVVEPGTDPAPSARGSQGGPLQLLCVASLTPRKGHETLVDALGRLTDRSWHLTCAGALDRDPEAVDRLRTRILANALADRVTLAGEMDEPTLAREYDRADLFVLATYYEGYGMAVAEALARGVPVVSTPTGAIADLIAGGAGVLVSPGDADALAAALRRVMDDEGYRWRLAAGAQRARRRLPTWTVAAKNIAAALSAVGAVTPARG